MTKTVDSSNLGYLIGKIRGAFWAKGDTSELAIDAAPTENSNNLVSSGGVFDAVNGQYIEAWDGASSPVAANIPAGVSVTYNGVTTTGSLAASASTKGKIYLVSDGNGQYDRYYTSYDGSTYSWAPMGSTAIDLSGYASQTEVDEIGDAIDGIDSLKTTVPAVAGGFPAYDPTATSGYYSASGNNVFINGTALSADTTFIKMAARIYKTTGAAYKAKLMAVSLTGNLPIYALGDEFTLPTPTDSFMEAEVTFATPFTVPAGYALGIVVDTAGVLRGRSGSGVSAYFRSVTYANMTQGGNVWPYAASPSTIEFGGTFYAGVSAFKTFATAGDIAATISHKGVDAQRTWTRGTLDLTTGAVTEDNTKSTAYSDMVAVRPGDKLYARCWAPDSNSQALIAAYDGEGKFSYSDSDFYTGSAGYYRLISYTVPDGICYLRLCTKKDSTADTTLHAAFSYDGDETVKATDILEKGAGAISLLQGAPALSNTHVRWFYNASNSVLLSHLKALPMAGLQEITVASGYTITLAQFDKDLNYLGSSSQVNSVFNRLTEAIYINAGCAYFLIMIGKTGGTADKDECALSILYDQDSLLGNNVSVPLLMKEYYAREIRKGDFLNATVINDWSQDKMAHGSRFVLDAEGNLVIVYYHSTTSESESTSTGTGVVVAKCNPCDLGDPVRVDALLRGEQVGTFQQTTNVSPYDANIIKVSDTAYNITMVMCEQGTSDNFIGIRQLNPETMTMGNTITRCKIVYNSVEYPLSVSGLNAMVDAIYGRAAGTTDIGQYPILTTRFASYGGELYAYLWSLTGASDTFSTSWVGALVKTEDYGVTWEVVSVPDITLSWTSPTNWEAGFEIMDDKAYVFFRNNANDAPICYYDLVGGSWSAAVDLIPITIPHLPGGQNTFIADASRPEVIAYDGYLYAAQNVKYSGTGIDASDVFRGMMCIWKMDADLNVVDFRIFQNAFGVHYFAMVMGNGFGYFSFTEDRTAKHQTTANYNKRDISVMPIEMGTLIW